MGSTSQILEKLLNRDLTFFFEKKLLEVLEIQPSEQIRDTHLIIEKKYFFSNLVFSYFFQILKGFGLGATIFSALLAAYFNVQIPLSIGSITSVIAQLVNSDEPVTAKEYWEQIKVPSLKFLAVVSGLVD